MLGKQKVRSGLQRMGVDQDGAAVSVPSLSQLA